jgi:hypothetical protein
VQPESGDSGVTDKDLLLADPNGTNRTLERQKQLDLWLGKWKFLWKVRLGKFGEDELSRHGGDDGVHQQIRAVEIVILRNLAKSGSESHLSELYNSVADYMDRLTKWPLPGFIKEAPSKIAKRAGKKKSGRPSSVLLNETESLQILDSIIILSTAKNDRFLDMKGPAKNISKHLGISRDALRKRREKVSSNNPWTERLKSEWVSFPPKDRTIEAEKRIRKEIDRLLAIRPKGSQRYGEK